MDDSPKRRGRRPTQQLTEPQLRVLRVIKDGIIQRGFPPTAKELGLLLGIAPATAHEQVNQLVKKGFLHREPHKARGLSILASPRNSPSILSRSRCWDPWRRDTPSLPRRTSWVR